MVIIILGFFIFVLSIACLYHWRNQPLYADDGNWFYDAEFNRTINLRRLDYFGIGFIAKYFRKFYFVKSEKAYYDLKIIWFSVLNSVLFILCYLLFDDYLIASLSVFFHLIFQVLPQTRYSLTYGENFLLLPLLISFLLFRYAYIDNNLFLYFFSGLFFGWAYQIKVVAIIPVAPLLMVSFFYTGFTELFVIVFGFFLINVLNIVKSKGLKNKIDLLKHIVKWHSYFYLVKVNFFNLKFLKNMYFPKNKKDNSYVKHRLRISYSSVWNQFNIHITPVIKITLFICVMALSTVFYSLIKKEIEVNIISVFFIGCFILPIVQKSIHPSHFNHTWLPVSILAAIGMRRLLISHNLYVIILSIILIVPSLITVIRIFLSKRANKQLLADYGLKYSTYFSSAKIVGEYIKDNSNQQEKVLSWGNMPSVYLYAHRECINTSFFHIYPTGHKNIKFNIQKLFDFMKTTPPEWITFFTGIYPKQDKWNINTLMDEIHIPYKTVKIFPVEANDKKFRPIPLYRRDANKYKELLIERFVSSKDEKHLEQVLKLYPNDKEALMRMHFSRNKLSFEQKKQYIEDFEAEKIDKAKVLADIYYLNQDIDSAELHYTNVLINEKHNLRSLIASAEISFLKGDIKSAYRLFTEAYNNHRYSFEALNGIGVVLFQTGDLRNAKIYFAKALEINPDFQSAKDNLTIIKEREQEKMD